jgi:uncharacterized RDD family membrane protein YckC
VRVSRQPLTKSVRIAAFSQLEGWLRVSTGNSYGPPQSAAYDDEPEELELSGRAVRLGASVVDGIVGFVMICLPALIVLVAAGAADAAFEPSATTINVSVLGVAGLLCLCGLVAWIWITVILVARNGQTIGKRLLEIKVVRSDGSPASLGRIFWLRNFVNVLLGVIPLYGLVDLLFIFGVRQQCIHDLLADTIVVRD